MDISIGLPNTLDVPGSFLVDWARLAEERGFASVGTIDRIVYPSFDSLTALSAAAGATSRIGLLSGILLAPLYPPVWLAKATASLDSISGGRLTLGLGVGGREDDFVAMGRSLDGRGPLMDETLDVLRRSWAGQNVTGDEFPVGPPPAGDGVPVLIGGNSEAAVRRTVEYGEGWIAGGGGPEAAAPMVEKIRKAWSEAGREGEPRIAALAYFGLGDPAVSRAALRSYYGFLGQWVDQVVESALRTPDDLRGALESYADVGVTEVVFDPTVASLEEVERLADVVL